MLCLFMCWTTVEIKYKQNTGGWLRVNQKLEKYNWSWGEGGEKSLIFFLLVPSVFRIRFNNNTSRRWQLELPAKQKRSLMNCGTFKMTGRQTQNYRIKPGDTKSISRTLYSNASHTRGNIAHQCHTCHRSHENCSKFNHNFKYEFLQMLV